MILNLHVTNLALVREADIEFTPGLNILTGETGAGKSIILGSINLALGAKAGADIIGNAGDSALVELTFSIEDEEVVKRLNDMDIFPEDGILTISRRINDKRSVIRINGETVNASVVRAITEELLDIHGQHDHQSLLYPKKHLEILDKYIAKELAPLLGELSIAYNNYRKAIKDLAEFNISEDERKRNISFIRYEVDEIDKANLQPNEDEQCEQLYKKMLNAQKIMGDVSDALKFLGAGESDGAAGLISRAYSCLSSASRYDEGLFDIQSQLSDVDNLLNDLNRELSDYALSLEFDDAGFREVEDRLNLINGLKAKYGNTLEAIAKYREEAAAKLAFYDEYEANLLKAEAVKQAAYKEACELCEKISTLRKSAAVSLSEEIKNALVDLNFNQVSFETEVRQLDEPTANGWDEVEFMISTNPGEAIRPLAKIASGGEMSRIMLGIKSVLADKDATDTLVFDEIDTGISGRTAQKVSEKMAAIAKDHQVICITHLPQIAAMADTHFLIEKNVVDGRTETTLNKLDEEAMVNELARMLSGYETTALVIDNARQMKELANSIKSE